MRQVLTLTSEILTVLDEYRDFVLANRPDKIFSDNWPVKGKFLKENRPEYATSLECIKSMKPETHDGFPPDSYGYDLNEPTIKQTLPRLSPEERVHAEKFLEKSRWLDDTLGNLLGYRFCALKMFYPENGYIAWHTNWNVPGYNAIFTWSDGTGYWRHIDSTNEKEGSIMADPEKNLVHLQDKDGWHVKLGYYGRKEEHNRIVWHSAFGGPRITLGFVVFDENIWADVVEELTAAE